MTKDELKQLFKEKILPHHHHPYHFEKVANPTHEVLAYNPFCGDKFTLQLRGEGKTIDQGYFQGFGCAISKASTSMLLKRVEGKSEKEIIEYCQQFLEYLAEEIPMNDEELQILAELKKFDGRVDCITLPWKALVEYLE
uniref:SUF system NifU family Fe-S cluster assembly protein n=1 Tax=Roseihalotalea indica TaxID=2867963 RepID=A0AA49GK76_9BACT|nr:SUF system NifU family Fe-S cluster assembly protein [Tunicatimonas sp. TK19036]